MLVSKFCQLRLSNNSSRLFSCSYATLGAQNHLTSVSAFPIGMMSSSAKETVGTNPLKPTPNGYLLFVRDLFQTKQVTIGAPKEFGGEMTKIGLMWKNLDADKKAKYIKLAKALSTARMEKIKLLSKEELLKLQAQKTASQVKELKSKGRDDRTKHLRELALSTGRPKRPTVLTVFMESQPNKSPDQSATQFVKELWQKYRNQTAVERKNLAEDYKKAAAKYLVEMGKWEKQMKADGKKSIVEEFAKLQPMEKFLTDEEVAKLKLKKERMKKLADKIRKAEGKDVVKTKKVAKKTAKKAAPKRKTKAAKPKARAKRAVTKTVKKTA